MYELQQTEFPSPEQWDAVLTGFGSWHLFHTAAWLQFVECTQPVERRLYRIDDGNELVGYLPGFAFRKGPVRIFGSPFPGWTTAYMGPVVRDGVDLPELWRSVAGALRREGFGHAELRPQLLECRGAEQAGFRLQPNETQVAEVAPDPEAILESFTKEGRRNVRLALRKGLQAVSSSEPGFVDLYYGQLQAVFAKQGLPPTYPRRRVERLWELLMPTGRMICIQVMRGDRCLATGIDLVGNGWLHSFGSAASQEPEDLKCYPNELRRYYGMCEAARRGIEHYDLTGVRGYKRKFGAQTVDRPVLLLSSLPLRLGREVFRGLNTLKMRLAHSRSRR